MSIVEHGAHLRWLKKFLRLTFFVIQCGFLVENQKKFPLQSIMKWRWRNVCFERDIAIVAWPWMLVRVGRTSNIVTTGAWGSNSSAVCALQSIAENSRVGWFGVVKSAWCSQVIQICFAPFSQGLVVHSLSLSIYPWFCLSLRSCADGAEVYFIS